jgi:ABC-type amino acid transport substrate-binding protein
MTAVDQKPFFYKDEKTGTLIGVDVEIGYEIANRLGVRPIFSRDAASFDDVVLKVVNNEVDIALSKLSRTPKRAALVRFTRPYITFRQALLVNRLELVKVTTEDNLPRFIQNYQASLGIINNSSYLTYAETNFPGAALKTYNDWESCVNALFAGGIVAVYRDELEILTVNETREDASILMKPVFITDKQDPIAMAVAADAPLLQEWLNIFLEEYLSQNERDLIPVRIVKRHYQKENK